MKNLSKALDREEEDMIIEGFINRYKVSEPEAREIFEETKKWLWLAAKAGDINEHVFIDKPLAIIDEMWHNFLLYTIPYYNFCMNQFNKFIHHVPTSNSDRKDFQNKQNEEETKKIREAKTRQQYSLIYDNLGPETLTKWYGTMAQKYTPEYINSIRKY